jgi:hypothetical protein
MSAGTDSARWWLLGLPTEGHPIAAIDRTPDVLTTHDDILFDPRANASIVSDFQHAVSARSRMDR